MDAEEEQFRAVQREGVDWSWLESVDPEIEQHLLPVERAILAALRRYKRLS